MPAPPGKSGHVNFLTSFMSGQRVRLLGGHDQTEPSNDGPGTGAGSNNDQFRNCRRIIISIIVF